MIKTIVLADDHRIVSEGLSLLLRQRKSLRVVAATPNGASAIAAVRHHRPDIAIFDICMPDVTGIVAAEQALYHSAATRIIMLSMHDDYAYVQEALRAGARGYVLKDGAGIELLGAIDTVLAGHRYLSPKLTDMVVDEFIATAPVQPVSSRRQINLSTRERDVLRCLVDGQSSAQIAERLSLATSTVDSYRNRVMQKAGVYSSAGLRRFALQHNLIGASPEVARINGQ